MPYSSTSEKIPENPTISSDVLTVSSLNRMARSLLENNFPAVMVEGEISSLTIPSSGHWYLNLKDNSAQIRCAMFRNRNMLLRFQPRNGMQVIVKGRLSIYEGRGDYQLIAEAMEEAGAGALRKAFEALKAKLAAEGLFDSFNKKPVADHYQHLGVISSGTGAAIRDVLSVLARRFPATRVTLFPAAVQGSEAKGDIVRALVLANRFGPALGIEALLLCRGGGSPEDLQAFNEEEVARAIFNSELVVVSAVGHEIDFTIADFVADLRAPTPSAAAELLSLDQEDYFQNLLDYRSQLSRLVQQYIRLGTQKLDWFGKRLKHPGRRLQEHSQTVDLLENRMHRAIRVRLGETRNWLREARRALHASSPERLITALSSNNHSLRHRLMQLFKQFITRQHDTLANTARSLNAVSPLATLGRGFSITLDENLAVLRSTKQVSLGRQIISQLRTGRLTSTVTAIDFTKEIDKS
jgi:exodeoxyribonuclease VII large subunit